MERDDVRTWPLPLGETPELEFFSDSANLVLAPLAPGEVPRLEASVRSSDHLRVEISKEGNVVRVHTLQREPFPGGFNWWLELGEELLGGEEAPRPEPAPFSHGPGSFFGWAWKLRVILYVPPQIRAKVHT